MLAELVQWLQDEEVLCSLSGIGGGGEADIHALDRTELPLGGFSYNRHIQRPVSHVKEEGERLVAHSPSDSLLAHS